jgi:hypothetical protein
VLSALSTFDVGSSIGTEVEPLCRVRADELFQGSCDLLRRSIDAAFALAFRKANRGMGGDLVSAMTSPGGKYRDDWSTRQHGQAKRALRQASVATEERYTTRTTCGGDSVDLQGHNPPVLKVPHQAEPGERLITNVRDLNSPPLANAILDGAGLRVALRPLGHEEPETATPADEGSNDLPTRGMTGDEQDAPFV